LIMGMMSSCLVPSPGAAARICARLWPAHGPARGQARYPQTGCGRSTERAFLELRQTLTDDWWLPPRSPGHRAVTGERGVPSLLPNLVCDRHRRTADRWLTASAVVAAECDCAMLFGRQGSWDVRAALRWRDSPQSGPCDARRLQGPRCANGLSAQRNLLSCMIDAVPSSRRIAGTPRGRRQPGALTSRNTGSLPPLVSGAGSLASWPDHAEDTDLDRPLRRRAPAR
jgi:hypothetical protein